MYNIYTQLYSYYAYNNSIYFIISSIIASFTYLINLCICNTDLSIYAFENISLN